MYYLAKIYKDHVDNAWKASATTYKQAFDNAAIIAKADNAIVAILIFSDMDTAIPVKRKNLLTYGETKTSAGVHSK